MYKLALFLSLIALGAALHAVTPVKKCNISKDQLFETVVIETSNKVCTELPCQLKPGTYVFSKIVFHVKNKVEKFSLKMNATINGSVIDYPVPEGENGCNWLSSTTCPIKANTDAALFYIYPVKEVAGNLTLITPYIFDENQKVIACFELPVKMIS